MRRRLLYGKGIEPVEWVSSTTECPLTFEQLEALVDDQYKDYGIPAAWRAPNIPMIDHLDRELAEIWNQLMHECPFERRYWREFSGD